MAAKYAMKKLENGNIRTCEVRLSFPHLFEKDDNGKYSVAVLFPKGADLSVLKEEIARVAKAEFPDKPIKGLRIGVRDQGEKDYEGYEDGAFFLSAGAQKTRPTVVDRKREPVVDEDEVFPGADALVTIKVYAFKPKPGESFGPGIGFGLQAVQLLGTGERLGGGGPANANDEFEELEGLAQGDSADSVFGVGDDDSPF